jgi:hypothetical protein
MRLPSRAAIMIRALSREGGFRTRLHSCSFTIFSMTLPRATRPWLLLALALGPLLQPAVASTAAPLPALAPAMTPGQSQVIAAPDDAPRRFGPAPRAVAEASGGTSAATSSGAPAACRLPSSIEAPAVRGPDHRNTTRTDYLMLVLSWSPAFCAELNPSSARRHAVQCSLNDFGFVVHGLSARDRGATIPGIAAAAMRCRRRWCAGICAPCRAPS